MSAEKAIEVVNSRLLRIDQVRQRTGLGRTSTYDLISKGLHPSPLKLGRCSMWVDREIDMWIEDLVRDRGLHGSV